MCGSRSSLQQCRQSAWQVWRARVGGRGVRLTVSVCLYVRVFACLHVCVVCVCVYVCGVWCVVCGVCVYCVVCGVCVLCGVCMCVLLQSAIGSIDDAFLGVIHRA
jgi:hypothetical protein